MNTGALFFCLFALFCFASATHECEKVSNATDCVWYDDSDIAVFVSALSGLKLVPVLNDNDVAGSRVTYSACIRPFISKICVNVEFDPWGDFFSNVTLSITIDGIDLWSDVVTIPQLMEPEGGLCLDDNTVLEILAEIPSLHDDLEKILAFLEATGCEPRGLFSACFLFNPCVGYQPTDDLCGCFEFDFQLLYWRSFCLYKFDGNIGCIGE